MRNFETPGRSLVMATQGMAATSHPLASLAAIAILQAGGNAVDAAIAACAVQCVVEPGSTGIGGDCFALLSRGGTDDIIAFNGAGQAPMGVSADRLRADGLTEIPRRSPAAVTIPGAIDAWSRMLTDHGTLSFAEALRPAIGYARDGYPVAPRVHAEWLDQQATLGRDANTRAVFLPDGKPPSLGGRHRQPALAETLQRIADHGRDGFYTGPVADDIVTYLQSLGGSHTLADFAAASGDYETPISAGFRDYFVYECPPPGHGVVALMMLKILEGLPHDSPALSAERLHLEIEAARQSYAIRDAVLADPRHGAVPTDWMLSDALATELRGRIDPFHAAEIAPVEPSALHADTVYLSVVDRDRNVVSFINSLFNQFGSGLTAPRSGVLLHNRGQGFSLVKGHPNEIQPGKRPMHTIIPGMLVKDGRVAMPFGVMGAHYQPMGQAHLVSKVIDYGMDVQGVIDLPRLFPLPGTKTVEVESGIPAETVHGLRARGFDIRRADRPIGGGQAIWIDWENDVLIGGSDPRKDGCAIGY